MNHPHHILVQAYLDEDLPSSEAGQIRDHIDGCASCQRTVQELREAKLSIRALDGIALPSTFAADISSAVRSTVDQEAEWSIIEKTAEKILTGIAIVVLFLLVASNLFVDETELREARTAGLLELFIRDTTVVRIVTAESLTRDDILAVALTREEGTTP